MFLAVAAAIFAANSLALPRFPDPRNLQDAAFGFTGKALIAFAITLRIAAGGIDMSEVSIMALAPTAMGAVTMAGAPVWLPVAVGAGTGLARCAFDRIRVAGQGLPSTAAAIGTIRPCRGIADTVPGDRAYTGYPPDFARWGRGCVRG